MAGRTVYFTGPREVTVREMDVPDPGPGELVVEATASAISPGTELLLYRGEMNPETAVDETLPSLSGSLSYPFPYGYSTVGTVTGVGPGVDPGWHGETVLAFHPHASEFVVDVEAVSRVPDGISPERAVFLPNVETAVTLALDGEPAIGERAVVFGQGVIGLLTTAILSSFPLAELVTVETLGSRRDRSEAMGADRSVDPDAVDPESLFADGPGGGRAVGGSADQDPDPGSTPAPASAPASASPSTPAGDRDESRSPDRADLTYELSGNPAALDDAVDATGYDGRVVVGSWYGTKPAELSLDGRFHRSRIDIRASQVSTLAPERRGRWTVGRRLATAWRRLRDIETDRLVTHRIPVAEAPDAYDLLDRRPEEAVQVLLTY
ncbi:zinc-binding alcohol dehydrogenase [Halobaculum roseum]|uniref:Oxidoreductase n=1 Tax=Halobaculum roseum TaxID=2175149 RepID=A0ABD5MP47_9EURY|nr:zinc-binding alcohol dehydrogenase [Halobaculum roseum]QZY01972.1 oxidoreductase [Halobaculum roseum]